MEFIKKLNEQNIIKKNLSKKENKEKLKINEYENFELGIDKILELKRNKNKNKNNTNKCKNDIAYKPAILLKRKEKLPDKQPDTQLRKLYNSKDLPFYIDHSEKDIKIKFYIDPIKLDFKYYLPILIDSLIDKNEPYRSITVMAFEHFIKISEKKLIKCIPFLINPIKNILDYDDSEIISLFLILLKKLLLSFKSIGKELLPHYRTILKKFPKFLKKVKNKNNDKMDYNQRFNNDLNDICQTTLETLEKVGGKQAFIYIKNIIPTYQKSNFD